MQQEFLEAGIAVLVALVGATAVERFTEPKSPWICPNFASNLFRVGAFIAIFAFFFLWSWRPVFAAFSTVVFVSVFAAISVAKARFFHEPLVFSDLAFVLDIFRHPKLFYTSFLLPLIAASIAVIAALIAAFFALEDPILSFERAPYLTAAISAGIVLALAAPWLPGLRRLPERAALALKSTPDIMTDLPRHGAWSTLVMDALAWRGADRTRVGNSPCTIKTLPVPIRAHPADLVVVVQGESFLDLRRLTGTGPRLPAFDAARTRALSWGPLRSVFPGGYTMRTECAFLTCRPPADLAFDRYYPYLHIAPYAPHALPNKLKNAGYRTTFIHPYYRDFFQRHRAIPALGFDRFIDLDDFAGAPRIGGYVADSAVGDRILAEARAGSGRNLIFVSTMENHGPWDEPRFDGATTPIAVLARHLENSSALLGNLIAELDTWDARVVLAYYGDHIPLIEELYLASSEHLTDYVLLEVGRKARPPSVQTGPRTLAAHELGLMTLAAAGISSEQDRVLQSG